MRYGTGYDAYGMWCTTALARAAASASGVVSDDDAGHAPGGWRSR